MPGRGDYLPGRPRRVGDFVVSEPVRAAWHADGGRTRHRTRLNCRDSQAVVLDSELCVHGFARAPLSAGIILLIPPLRPAISAPMQPWFAFSQPGPFRFGEAAMSAIVRALYAELRFAIEDRVEFFRLAHRAPDVPPAHQAVYWQRWGSCEGRDRTDRRAYPRGGAAGLGTRVFRLLCRVSIRRTEQRPVPK